MIKKKISCNECGFNGLLTFDDEECTFTDIIHCPTCGFDLSDDVITEDDFDFEYE